MNKKTFVFCFIFLLIFISRSSVSLATSENITHINFTTPPQTIDKDVISATLTIQTQNIAGEPEKVSETNHLTLNSSSATGQFSSSSTNWTPVTSLAMSTNSANRNFYYRDSTPGPHTLSVSAEGRSWAPATQDIVITGVIPVTLSNIRITTPANKLNYLVGESLDIAGLVVTGTYSDGSTSVETVTGADISGFDSSAVATNQVLTVTVNGKTVTYTINVNPLPEVVVIPPEPAVTPAPAPRAEPTVFVPFGTGPIIYSPPPTLKEAPTETVWLAPAGTPAETSELATAETTTENPIIKTAPRVARIANAKNTVEINSGPGIIINENNLPVENNLSALAIDGGAKSGFWNALGSFLKWIFVW